MRNRTVFMFDGMYDGNLNIWYTHDNQSVQWLHFDNVLFIAYDMLISNTPANPVLRVLDV